ncbi:MAG TPA: NHL repeat-containing protein [Candidatus Baltobacteraceae bacterium]|nr:NHL repeat-containing protein [Candidatus Baltobacteraceae bacterium]
MTIDRWFRAVVVSCALVPLAACGGGTPSGPTLSAHALVPSTITTTARLRITIPHTSSSTVGGKLRPAYVSSATQSAIINVTPQGSGTSVSGYPQTVNLTPTTNGCTSSVASTQCTLALAFAPGNYNITLTTYDQTGGAGNVLSKAQSVPFTVSSGAVNAIALTLGGIPSSVQFVPVSGTLTGSVNLGFTLTTNAAANMMVSALDSDGNVIVGAGAPTISVASSNSAQLSVTNPTTAAPNTITVTSIAQAALVTLTATVTPTASSGASAVIASAVVAPPVTALPPRIYVTNQNNTITAYDVNGNQLTLSGSFPNLVNPEAIAYNPASGFLYVADNNGAILTYDLNGNQQTLSGSFSGVSVPTGLAYDPVNGFLYVANLGGSSVKAYDKNGNLQTLSGSFPNLNLPRGIAYDPANGFLYVANNNSTVTAYDQNGNQQTLSGSFPNLSLPLSIAYNSANSFFYLFSTNSTAITAYNQNGSQQTLSGTFPHLNSSHGIVFEPANGFLYVANNGNSTVTAYDQNGNQQTLSGTFPNLNFPAAIGLAP